jgi:hypothetical protein
MSLKFLICALGLLLSANASIAQENFDEKFGKMIPDATAMEAIKIGLSKIHTAKCEANKSCEPTSATELANPPIKIVDSRAAMVFGIKSALAQWCGLDWKRGFLPMIAFGKQKMKYNDRQLQLITLIHGDFQGRQLATYTKSGQCPATLQSQLDTQLPKLNR